MFGVAFFFFPEARFSFVLEESHKSLRRLLI